MFSLTLDGVHLQSLNEWIHVCVVCLWCWLHQPLLNFLDISQQQETGSYETRPEIKTAQ